MPAYEVVADSTLFLVVVMTPLASYVIVSMNDAVLPEAVGLGTAACFGLYAESWLWLASEYVEDSELNVAAYVL